MIGVDGLPVVTAKFSVHEAEKNMSFGSIGCTSSMIFVAALVGTASSIDA